MAEGNVFTTGFSGAVHIYAIIWDGVRRRENPVQTVPLAVDKTVCPSFMRRPWSGRAPPARH